MSTATDPLRHWISNFGSGLEHLWEALRYKHDRKIRKSVLVLSIRCLALHTIASGVAYLLPDSLSSVSRHLFHPAIFLYRYIRPKPWDKLFIGTVRSLDCAQRPDVVAKPTPEYFTQLSQYCRRSFKAYIGITIIQWLISLTGIFRLPCLFLSLVAVDQVLQYKGIKNAFWKLILISLLIGPKWPIWVVQTALLQQLFMYELLQPYLARVNFKGWEERAWLAQNEIELQGFAFGAHLLCSIPLLGVAAIPFMFPAVAFFLTRSCGSLMNSSHGLGGDVIERQSPGVKSVALGKSKSVEGNWDEPRVTTFVRNMDPEVVKPQMQSKDTTPPYSVDNGLNKPVDKERIHADIDLSLLRKADLYREAKHNAKRAKRAWMHQNLHAFGGPPMRPKGFFGYESTNTVHQDSNPACGSKTGPASTDELDNNTSQEDFTKHNFSDRKTLTSAPSAPPPPSEHNTTGPEEEHNFGDRKTLTSAPSAPPPPSEHITAGPEEEHNFSDRKTLMSAPSAPPPPSEHITAEPEKVFRVTAHQAGAEYSPSVDDNEALHTRAQEHDIIKMEQKRRAADAKRKQAEQKRTADEKVVEKAYQVSIRTPLETSVGNANTESESDATRETEEIQSAQDENEAEAREKDEEKPKAQEDEELFLENESDNKSSTVPRGPGMIGRGGYGVWGPPRGGRGGYGGRGAWGFGRDGRGYSYETISNSYSDDGDNADSDASVTGGARSVGGGLSGAITRGVQDLEHYVNQQVEGLGNELMQRLRDAVANPDNPQQFKFKIGGVDR